MPARRPPARVTAAVILAALAVAVAAGITTGARATSVARTYSNPLSPGDFADPTVLRDGPLYYAYATSSQLSNVQVLESADLSSWFTVTNEALPMRPEWAGWPDLWAPAVVRIGPTYVLWYSVRERTSGLMCLSRALAAHPAGPFRDLTAEPTVCHRSKGGTIDPHVFVDGDGDGDGAAWLLYKTEGVAGNEPPRIWSQRLSPDGLAVTGAPVSLLAPDRPWEGGIIEAPSMIRHGGRLHLFYSGGHWHSAGYAVGHAVCASPAGPCERRGTGPVLAGRGNVAGPGGQDVFADAQGQLWMAYHAWRAGTVGYPGGARTLRIDPLRFWGDHALVFGPTEGPHPLQGVPDHPAVALVGTPAGAGYGVVTRDGDVFVHGARTSAGSAADAGEWRPFTDAASTRSGHGYWLVTDAGRVAAFGDALHHYDRTAFGRAGAHPVVAIVPSATGLGYLLVDGAGRVDAFGDAVHAGDLAGRALPHGVVDAAPTADGLGYWLADAAGGVHAFGSAVHAGDLARTYLHQPVVGIVAAPGGGYWLVDRVGRVSAFGGALHHGDLRSVRLAYPVVDLAPAPGGTGYWLLANDGRVFPFGTARGHGWTRLPGG